MTDRRVYMNNKGKFLKEKHVHTHTKNQYSFEWVDIDECTLFTALHYKQHGPVEGVVASYPATETRTVTIKE